MLLYLWPVSNLFHSNGRLDVQFLKQGLEFIIWNAGKPHWPQPRRMSRYYDCVKIIINLLLFPFIPDFIFLIADLSLTVYTIWISPVIVKFKRRPIMVLAQSCILPLVDANKQWMSSTKITAGCFLYSWLFANKACSSQSTIVGMLASFTFWSVKNY